MKSLKHRFSNSRYHTNAEKIIRLRWLPFTCQLLGLIFRRWWLNQSWIQILFSERAGGFHFLTTESKKYQIFRRDISLLLGDVSPVPPLHTGSKLDKHTLNEKNSFAYEMFLFTMIYSTLVFKEILVNCTLCVQHLLKYTLI